MKGIILAGGSGTRLFPITKAISKQLMPIYDKPMIYYPLSVLMMADIREILIITTPEDSDSFRRLLGDGHELGCRFEYAVQAKDKVALILGDNIFHGNGFGELIKAFNDVDGAAIFAYRVSDPERYGVVEFDGEFTALSIEEKPLKPKSSYAVPGLYFYDNEVVEIAKNIQPSARGEYEITDVNRVYLEKKRLHVGVMDRGTAWLDTGTFDSLSDATEFVRVIEKRQDTKIGCIEEVAYRHGFIDARQLSVLAEKYIKSGYGMYLKSLLQ